MLKIKDGLYAKELEKFGLKYYPEQRNQFGYYE